MSEWCIPSFLTTVMSEDGGGVVGCDDGCVDDGRG